MDRLNVTVLRMIAAAAAKAVEKPELLADALAVIQGQLQVLRESELDATEEPLPEPPATPWTASMLLHDYQRAAVLEGRALVMGFSIRDLIGLRQIMDENLVEDFAELRDRIRFEQRS